MTRQLHLNAFLMNVGHHEAAWRHPLSDPHAGRSARHFIDLARTAERGKLDSIFFADGLAVGAAVRHNTQGGLDPLAILNAVATHTERIGLIATVSTSFTHPFTVARAFASLDHLSGGRAGWNIVTSGSEPEARNFDLDRHHEHAARYRRAAEHVDVAVALWDSWEDGAVVADTASGEYVDTGRVHEIRHRGEHFAVQGPLTTPRSPQGRPVLVQAGSSEDGREFAARYAEAVFTAWQTLEEARAFAVDLRARAARVGRDPDLVKVLPGIVPVIGDTEAEARALAAELDELLVWDHGLAQLSGILTLSLGHADLDRPLAELELPDPGRINGNRSRYELVTDLGRRERLTVRQVIARLGGGRGHRTFTGTPEQVADTLEEWFTAGAADGFNVMAPLQPSQLERFVDGVVPILQDRGLFRREYAGSTLREHYGLPRPASAFAGGGTATSRPLTGTAATGTFAGRRLAAPVAG
ncbi:LLM class flavin-dependent oxidoreductase [Trujillonella endophytica]|uniref:FMN-dependent oxidoreductase, nitrilotriacetate monooxygenase family n=1 Tax=Trujillonella endophytica TaxID=673521 RepID=A0A1H8TKK2_9ACTN|nr:LLM class flavin-dependent oxidoreductase [Trujillella endophytica]SEO91502.1 FMN-dependent oxidoreductase, nitrilotriacetate monooxygenase family [Trujillella endophytica]